MNLIDLLLTVTRELDSQGATHALTGGIASSIYGQLLPSLDADLAVRMTPAQARAVSESLQHQFYVSSRRMSAAVGTTTS